MKINWLLFLSLFMLCACVQKYRGYSYVHHFSNIYGYPIEAYYTVLSPKELKKLHKIWLDNPKAKAVINHRNTTFRRFRFWIEPVFEPAKVISYEYTHEGFYRYYVKYAGISYENHRLAIPYIRWENHVYTSQDTEFPKIVEMFMLRYDSLISDDKKDFIRNLSKKGFSEYWDIEFPQ